MRILFFLIVFSISSVKAEPRLLPDTIDNWQIYYNGKILNSGNINSNGSVFSVIKPFVKTDTISVSYLHCMRSVSKERYLEIKNQHNHLLKLYKFEIKDSMEKMTIKVDDFYNNLKSNDIVIVYYYELVDEQLITKTELIKIYFKE